MKKRSSKQPVGGPLPPSAPRRRPARGTVPAANPVETPAEAAGTGLASAIGLSERELAPVLEGTSDLSLARAKTHWFFGEWSALAQLDVGALGSHPDRDRFALLAASAHQQLGNPEEARRLVRRALEWGCPQRLVAQVLIAGVHNTLGRASALREDDARTEHHFQAAVALTASGDVGLATHARSVREMARLGLLPQAATLLDKELREAKASPARPEEDRARLAMLETEVELLRGALNLAQQRQQLHKPAPESANPARHADAPGELRKQAVSQLGQELWVLERTGYKRGGFFVDFGATDGVLLNNTWMLETSFGWKGICAEPNPKFFAELRKNRRCQVSDACIGARTGEEVEFLLADEYSGMKKHANQDSNAARRAGYLANPGAVVKMRTVSLDDLLKRMGAPRHIDYLSIDTEGSELEILAAFPFSDWEIDLITVEHNFTPQRREIQNLLLSHGYDFVGAQWDDWFYRPEV